MSEAREPDGQPPPSDLDDAVPSVDEEVATRAKALIRKRGRSLRASLPEAAVRARSAEIIARLEAMPELAAARSVALFWPIVEKREVDLRALDARLRERGVRVAYPAVHPDTRVMTFRFAEPGDLEERGLGFAEPSHGAPAADGGSLDVVVVPAIQLDPAGNRIGYGAGFYDRALPTVRPPAVAIGVVFDFQLAVDLPTTPRDVRIDWIVTEARTLRASPPG